MESTGSLHDAAIDTKRGVPGEVIVDVHGCSIQWLVDNTDDNDSSGDRATVGVVTIWSVHCKSRQVNDKEC
jgi:hypothetical protein